jgi:hypothetical protein
MVLATVLMGLVALVMIVAITALAAPPEKWVKWFGGEPKDTGSERDGASKP